MSETETLETQTEPTVAPATSATETPSASPAPSSPAPAEPAQPQPAAAQPHSVPLDVLLRTREEFGGKLSQAEQRALAAERALADIRKREQEQAAEIPHPLDEPEKFVQWQRNYIAQTTRALEQKFEQRRMDDRLQTSRELIEDQLQPEEFKKLCAYIDTWPQAMHTQAQKQPHPYRWALRQMRDVEKAKRSEEVLSKLGEKSLDELIEERVAARLAEQQAAGQPNADPAPDARPRNPDGTFASPSQPQQRHRPVSLAVVDGAPAPRGGEVRSGYDAAFKRG